MSFEVTEKKCFFQTGFMTEALGFKNDLSYIFKPKHLIVYKANGVVSKAKKIWEIADR